MYLKYPTKYISITQDYSVSHTAIDIGWHQKENDPLYACGDGVVEKIYTFTEGGNTLRIKYDNNYSSEFMHIRNNTITVKVGDRVTYNQKVAEIGNTGTQTTGPHVHVIMRNEKDVRVDPKSCLYIYSDQTVADKDKNKVLYNSEIKQIIDPVSRDTNFNQIEIKIDTLRVRSDAKLTSTVLGYIKKGIHNYYETRESDNYTWYKVGNNNWVAYSNNWAVLYPKVSSSTCEDQINVLNAKIIEQQNEIITLQNKIKQYENNSYKLLFECNKTDMYAIKLTKGEKIFIQSK